MTPAQKLQASVRALYDVFSAYARPKYLPGAMGDIAVSNDSCGLLSKPIRELTIEDLKYYSYSAITTLGSVNDFKFYLPRVLELVSLDPSVLDVAIVFSKLSYGRWDTWPTTEQRSLLAYLANFWENTLLCSPALCDARSCLDGLAQAKVDIAPFLDTWALFCDEHETAVEHLIEFCTPEIGDSDNTERIRFSSWLTYLPDQMELIRSWLFSPRIKEIVLRACNSLSECVDSQFRAEWVLETYLNDYARYSESGKP
jgi:hypothetical protein